MTYQNLHTKQKKSNFLKSNIYSQIFTGSKSEQKYFGRYLNKFNSDQLNLGNKKRRHIHKNHAVEKKLVAYLYLRAKSYKCDKCGVTWNLMRSKCLLFVVELTVQETYKYSTASNICIAWLLKDDGKIGIKLH